MAELLTIDEAARRLRLGRTVFYELLRREKLRSVRIGGARRIIAADLDAFIEKLAAEGEVHVDG